MKTLKPYLQSHKTDKEAVKRTTKKNVIAVKVKTYSLDTLVSNEFYSFKTNKDLNNFDGTLMQEFPLPLGSNQTIEEIDANDY